MLDPEDRQLVRTLLQPPPGFHFDRAVTTTFSLDLMTLLTMPVAFTMFERAGLADGGEVDPIALLQAMRQHAGRIHVFCQTGQIAVPKHHHLLFAHACHSNKRTRDRSVRQNVRPLRM